jgi:hypothetical protein
LPSFPKAREESQNLLLLFEKVLDGGKAAAIARPGL